MSIVIAEIAGTPLEIVQKLEAVKRVAQRYNEEGFEIYQQDEEWNYITRPDLSATGPCPTCMSFGGKWNGAQVGIEFKDVKTVHPFVNLAINERYPDVHTTYPHLPGICRCILELIDYVYTFNNRLMRDVEAVLT